MTEGNPRMETDSNAYNLVINIYVYVVHLYMQCFLSILYILLTCLYIISQESPFTIAEKELFKKRYTEGYDLTIDHRYNQ